MSTRSVRGQGLQVTLAAEDDKPEDGEEIELRRYESSPRTTRRVLLARRSRKGDLLSRARTLRALARVSLRSQKVCTRGEEKAGG